jgi:hypothetical protein
MRRPGLVQAAPILGRQRLQVAPGGPEPCGQVARLLMSRMCPSLYRTLTGGSAR